MPSNPCPEKGPPRAGWLDRYRAAGLLPRHARGQHFLTDPALLDSIAEAAGLTDQDTVFEVGTGPATLTRSLAARAGCVLSVEVDPRLAAFAERELRGHSNVEILQADVLPGQRTLAPLVVERLRSLGAFVWVSNLPYGIATPLTIELLRQDFPWRQAVLLVQAEVAERFAASPGSGRRAAYGPASVLVQSFARVERLRRLRPGAFWPPPKVDSALIRLQPAADPVDPALFDVLRGWVLRLFRERRKQLGGLLRDAVGPEQAALILRVTGWDPGRRPESLERDDFVRLARGFSLDRS